MVRQSRYIVRVGNTKLFTQKFRNKDQGLTEHNTTIRTDRCENTLRRPGFKMTCNIKLNVLINQVNFKSKGGVYI